MPVYDYICNDCKKSFEMVLTLAEHDKERISCRTAAARMWSSKRLRSLP